jgi:hypothetical protein
MLANGGKHTTLGYCRVTFRHSKCRDRIIQHQSYFSLLLRRPLTTAYLICRLSRALPSTSRLPWHMHCISILNIFRYSHRFVGNFCQSFHLLLSEAGPHLLGLPLCFYWLFWGGSLEDGSLCIISAVCYGFFEEAERFSGGHSTGRAPTGWISIGFIISVESNPCIFAWLVFHISCFAALSHRKNDRSCSTGPKGEDAMCLILRQLVVNRLRQSEWGSSQ